MEVEGVRIIDGLLLQTSSVAPVDGLMLKRLLFWRAVGVEGGLILLLGIGTQSTMAIKKLSSNEYNTIKASPLNPSSLLLLLPKVINNKLVVSLHTVHCVIYTWTVGPTTGSNTRRRRGRRRRRHRTLFIRSECSE